MPFKLCIVAEFARWRSIPAASGRPKLITINQLYDFTRTSIVCCSSCHSFSCVSSVFRRSSILIDFDLGVTRLVDTHTHTRARASRRSNVLLGVTGNPQRLSPMQISVSWSPPNGVSQRRAAVHAGRQLGGCTSRRLGGYPFRRFELISSAIHGHLPLRIISTELPRDIRRETSRILPKYLTADDTWASKLVGRVVDTLCCFAGQDPKINAKTRFLPRHCSRAAGSKNHPFSGAVLRTAVIILESGL